MNLRASLSIIALLILACTPGHAAISCAETHDNKTPVLLESAFLMSAESAAVEAVGAKRMSSKNLTIASQEGLTKAGVQFTSKEYIVGAPLIEISMTGDHLLNKIAKRIYEIDGTRLVYDAFAVRGGTTAFTYRDVKDMKRIYLSNVTALTGKLDSAFFHEIKHWSMVRKTSQGHEQIFDATARRFPWDFFSGLILRSGYKILSFQERTTFMYQTKLFVKAMLAEAKTKSNNNLFLFSDLQMEISGTMDVVSDVKTLAADTKYRIENKAAKIRLKTTKEGQELYIWSLTSSFRIYLPKGLQEDFTNPEVRRQYALKNLNKTIEQTEKDLENLNRALGLAQTLYMGMSKNIVETLEKIDSLIEI